MEKIFECKPLFLKFLSIFLLFIFVFSIVATPLSASAVAVTATVTAVGAIVCAVAAAVGCSVAIQSSSSNKSSVFDSIGHSFLNSSTGVTLSTLAVGAMYLGNECVRVTTEFYDNIVEYLQNLQATSSGSVAHFYNPLGFSSIRAECEGTSFSVPIYEPGFLASDVHPISYGSYTFSSGLTYSTSYIYGGVSFSYNGQNVLVFETEGLRDMRHYYTVTSNSLIYHYYYSPVSVKSIDVSPLIPYLNGEAVSVNFPSNTISSPIDRTTPSDYIYVNTPTGVKDAASVGSWTKSLADALALDDAIPITLSPTMPKDFYTPIPPQKIGDSKEGLSNIFSGLDGNLSLNNLFDYIGDFVGLFTSFYFALPALVQLLLVFALGFLVIRKVVGR